MMKKQTGKIKLTVIALLTVIAVFAASASFAEQQMPLFTPSGAPAPLQQEEQAGTGADETTDTGSGPMQLPSVVLPAGGIDGLEDDQGSSDQEEELQEQDPDVTDDVTETPEPGKTVQQGASDPDNTGEEDDDEEAEENGEGEEGEIFYNVRFMLDENTVLLIKKVKEQRAVLAAPELELENEGYTLSGWLLHVPAGEETSEKYIPYIFGLPVTADIDLYPDWAADEPSEDEEPEEGETGAEGEEPDNEDGDENFPGELNSEDGEDIISGESDGEDGEDDEEDEEDEETDPSLEEEETEEEQEAFPVQKAVILATTAGGEVNVGDVITLYAIVIGYDDVEYTLSWQYNADGERWKTAQVGGSTFNFVLTEENYRWDWRIELNEI